MNQPPVVMLLGAFDTKGAEYAYARARLIEAGVGVLSVDFGVHPPKADFPVDLGADEVAAAAGEDLQQLRSAGDRGRAMHAMSRGVAAIAARLFQEGRIDAVFGMGGSGGTSVITAAMRALPLGVPKVCLSTVAGGDTAPYVAQKDIVLYPSIADIAGLNRITRRGIQGAAAAVAGMAQRPASVAAEDRPVITASMFGNTTECVDRCRAELERDGYEVLVFHATGAGGKAMESLIDEGLVDASLDLTTTELADTLCGGVFDAGPARLTAAGRRGIPQVVAPGCVDMVNFGPPDTVPERYRTADRLLYEWNPSVTLMRTTPDENSQLGRMIAERLNAAAGPTAVILPLRGYSILGAPGGAFHNPEAEEALAAALRAELAPRVRLVEVDAAINAPEFAEAAVALLRETIASHEKATP
ncbi:Tm-1-like ATP-binding domain-containing protein [Botrimarina sp.]|uniref:Tm-1-like ATP-binding domain-containing protein n=1 Tax=Botrimarina sp. TaxID=2795802 RepID=UPI0032EB5D62